MKNNSWFMSFRHALDGVAYTLRNERNFKIHFVAAFFALSAGLYLKIGRTELLFVVLAIGAVFAAETFNTAIEKAVDYRTGGAITPWAKAAKDAAAGAVLITAIFAAIAGLIIFIPELSSVSVWGIGAGRALLAAAISGLAALLLRKAASPWAAAVFSMSASLMFLTGRVWEAVLGYALAVLFAAGLAGGEKNRLLRVVIGGLGGLLVSMVVFLAWR